MSLPTTRQAFGDCYEILDKAVDADNGVRVPFKDYDTANYMRMRLHQARKINREDNKAQYEPGHPLFGASVYDKIAIRIRQLGERYYLYLQPHTIDTSIIEEITEGDEAAQALPAPEPQRMLEPPRDDTPQAEPIRRRI